MTELLCTAELVAVAKWKKNVLWEYTYSDFIQDQFCRFDQLEQSKSLHIEDDETKQQFYVLC